MNKIWIPPLLLAIMLSQSGHLTAQGRGYMIYGMYGGDTPVSCGTFARSPQKEFYRWWIMGFVSGAGHAYLKSDVLLSASDTGGIEAWVDEYCEKHPLDSTISAAVALVQELRSKTGRP